jgi:hypothetical protein
MSRMVELIKRSEVPPEMLRLAAKGALHVPPAEMVEILVCLTKNPIFAEQARMTLAGWDETSCKAVAADPQTPADVLDYMADPQNYRPTLLNPLLNNPSVPENKLAGIACRAAADAVPIFLGSARISRSPAILEALKANSQVGPHETAQIESLLTNIGATPDDSDVLFAAEEEPLTAEELASLAAYMRDHAAEIASEEGRPFQLVESTEEELDLFTELAPELSAAAAAAAGAAGGKPVVAGIVQTKGDAEPKKKISVLQKIALMNVGERVQLAMKGNKDERFLLIRDGAKVVALAVLESPKITDTEVDVFASMKNVQEIVLRGIAGKRKFMKRYSVIKNLITNPKCPIDLSLTLLNHMMITDLKGLSINKEVPETVRKMALRLFLQKSDSRHGR